MGPVQIIVVGFDQPRFRGEALEELRRLRDHDIVRLVDMLAVTKDAEGNVRVLEAGELPEQVAGEFGEVTRSLIGFGDQPPSVSATDLEDGWDVVDAIPAGSTAVIALLEHRWAIPLRDAIVRAGGTALADAWLHREDLAAVGLETSVAGAAPGPMPE
ncbi:MAG: hypothetical protein J2P45_10645 [Candidatus Dormibacteraeota bacterium]|nr:hypothetical protein [Candidatus Dormibacteraeota bacterium]